jgi:hypothetical protein
VIEIPEVEHPDKLVTLELLSKDTKKSLNYSVESALTKGIKLTDHIHGETNIIVKSDLDGFTIYGFEENNLMSKNAVMDIDMWKAQVEEIMKSKQSDLTVAVFQYLKMNGDKTPKQIHNYLVEKQPSLYEDVLESKEKDVKEWFSLRDGISLMDNKLSADDDKIMQEDDIKKSKNKAINRIMDILQAGKDYKPDNPVDLNETYEIATVEIDEDDTCCNQLKEDFKKLLLEDAKGANMGKRYIDFIHNYMSETNCEEILDLLSRPEVFVYGQEKAKSMLDKHKKCSEGFNAVFTDKYAMLKAYKTPDNYRKGQFKLYSREDDNITFAIKVDDESMFWTIDLENDEEMFDLFGAAGKYPAEVSKNIERGKVIDSGDIELGVQKDGYHEYFLKGNKFETKLHIRVIKVDGKEMWLAWTGYKQTPADKDGDEGKWNIYQDRYNKLPIPTSE